MSRPRFRLASETEFPYGWPGRVMYFTVRDGRPAQITTRDEHRAAVAAACGGQVELWAVWPGDFRADLFLIDEPQALARTIGLTIEAAS